MSDQGEPGASAAGSGRPSWRARSTSAIVSAPPVEGPNTAIFCAGTVLRISRSAGAGPVVARDHLGAAESGHQRALARAGLARIEHVGAAVEVDEPAAPVLRRDR